MRTALLALTLLLVAAPASAHRLKLFATVEDGTVTGYAFFIGGGRPQGAMLLIRGASGQELYRGTTDDRGQFSWRPQAPADLVLTVDARDGHVAEARLAADRFSGVARAVSSHAATPPAPHSSGLGDTGLGGAAAKPGGVDAAVLAGLIDQAVDRAVSRQVRPLLEAYDEADGKVRINDVIGGVGMIVGLAGIALWASSRRSRRAGGATPGKAAP